MIDIVIYLLISTVFSQYLPGYKPIDYCLESKVENCEKHVKVFWNDLYSKIDVPYSFEQLGLCSDKTVDDKMNDQMSNWFLLNKLRPAFNVEFGKSECFVLCKSDILDSKKIINAIKKRYFHEWFIELVPVSFDDGHHLSTFIPVGCSSSDFSNGLCRNLNLEKLLDNQFVIYNNWEITIKYKKNTETGLAQIVSTAVEPHSSKTGSCSVNSDEHFILTEGQENTNPIEFTYNLKFELVVDENLSWVSRWDFIFKQSGEYTTQWINIVVVTIVTVIMIVISVILLLRSLGSDVIKYNQLTEINMGASEFGWKLLHGDVFRSPKYPMLLSVSVANGLQILLMILTTLLFVCLGFFSPFVRGSFTRCLLILFILYGFINGYISAVLYKFFNGLKWKRCTLVTAFFYPSLLFFVLLILNIRLSVVGSSAAVSFLPLFGYLVIWLLVSVPLCFFGSFLGYKTRIKLPSPVNMIPRYIPPQPLYIQKYVAIPIASLIAFGSVFAQLYLLFNNIWLPWTVITFGFIFVALILFYCICAVSSVISAYLHLCYEDYRWQWRSFSTMACIGLYIMFYAFINYVSIITNSLNAYIFFFSYAAIVTICVSLSAGSIAFLVTFQVILRMYNSIKID